MSFKENIKRICAEQGTSLTSVVKEVKGSGSFTTSINNGSLPKETEMVKIAELLKCSVIDFFADEEDLVSQNKKPPHTEDEEDIIRIYQSLSRRAKHEFMTMVYEYENKKEADNDLSTLN